jgi:hypothetical protein
MPLRLRHDTIAFLPWGRLLELFLACFSTLIRYADHDTLYFDVESNT